MKKLRTIVVLVTVLTPVKSWRKPEEDEHARYLSKILSLFAARRYRRSELYGENDEGRVKLNAARPFKDRPLWFPIFSTVAVSKSARLICLPADDRYFGIAWKWLPLSGLVIEPIRDDRVHVNESTSSSSSSLSEFFDPNILRKFFYV